MSTAERKTARGGRENNKEGGGGLEDKQEVELVRGKGATITVIWRNRIADTVASQLFTISNATALV